MNSNSNDAHLSQTGIQPAALPPFQPADLTADSIFDSPDPPISLSALLHPDQAPRQLTQPHSVQPAASMAGAQAPPDPWDVPLGDSFASPPPVWEQLAASVPGFTQVWDSASPAPVWEQRPVQDPELEGERVLHDLETLAPAHLFTQVGLTVSTPPPSLLELEGERVLHDLETLAPAHLFTQVGLTR